MDIRKPYAKAVTQAEKDTLTVEMKEKLMNDVDTSVAELNKYLKKIAAEINLDKSLSMHISRHSFAHIAKGRGADNFDLQQIMAHSSLKTTENYMGNFDTSKGDQTLINIFSKKSGQVGKDVILEMIHSLRPKEQFELFEILKSDWE
ncbi:MAG: tyrosine-type recombinase/integrase [Bacteroidaceae bacterium]|nr:tyrosine-type recombinase/integrase [Bacteroidaceae bacterium]